MSNNRSIQAVATAAARSLGHRDGDVIMQHLRRITIDRHLDPAIDENILRHIEGQRWLYRHLVTLIQAGKNGTANAPP